MIKLSDIIPLLISKTKIGKLNKIKFLKHFQKYIKLEIVIKIILILYK